MPQTIHTLLIQYLSEIQKIYGAHVTYSRHLNLTDFEVGASCSIALQGKAKTGYPRVSRGSFLSGYGSFRDCEKKSVNKILL